MSSEPCRVPPARRGRAERRQIDAGRRLDEPGPRSQVRAWNRSWSRARRSWEGRRRGCARTAWAEGQRGASARARRPAPRTPSRATDSSRLPLRPSWGRPRGPRTDVRDPRDDRARRHRPRILVCPCSESPQTAAPLRSSKGQPRSQDFAPRPGGRALRLHWVGVRPAQRRRWAFLRRRRGSGGSSWGNWMLMASILSK